MSYVVAIVEQETERTVKVFEPCASERDAERLHNGVLRNLDTDRYYVEVRKQGK